jgi:acetyl esterase/lipase
MLNLTTAKLLFAGLALMLINHVHAQSLSFRDILQRPAIKADERISYGTDPLQFGDLWLPFTKDANMGPHPVVVLIHGGCWLAELPGVELTHFMADDLRKNGFAVWEIEYRRIGHSGGGYPGTFLDVAHGTDHLRKIASKHNLDLNRVIATGHSAGGHLALWLAARPRLPDSSALKLSSPLAIHAVVGVAAIPDLNYFADSGAHACGAGTVKKLVDFDSRKTATVDPYRDTSPVELLPIGVKQFMIHGVFDGIVPPVNGLRHKTRAAAKGEQVQLLTIAEASHFELIAPWTRQWQEVLAVFKSTLAGLKPSDK